MIQKSRSVVFGIFLFGKKREVWYNVGKIVYFGKRF